LADYSTLWPATWQTTSPGGHWHLSQFVLATGVSRP